MNKLLQIEILIFIYHPAMKTFLSRKSFLITIILLFLPIFICSIYAQKNLYAGYSLGISSSKWAGDADSFADLLTEGVIEGLNEEGFYAISGIDFAHTSRIGFYLGFFVEQRLIKSLYLHPELSYSFKGTRYKTDDMLFFSYQYKSYNLDFKEILTYKCNYLDLPVLLLYRFSEKKGKVKPFLEIGPHASVLISSKMKVSTDVDGDYDSDQEKYDQIERFDYGLNAGGGLDFGDGSDAYFRVEFRYQWGFKPVIKEEYDDGFKMKNRFFVINMAFVL